MTTTSTQVLEEIERPDTDLPAELQHGGLREVRGDEFPDVMAYELIFDGLWPPFGYEEQIRRAGWEIRTAWVEYQQPDGFLGWLRSPEACIALMVKKDDGEGGEAA